MKIERKKQLPRLHAEKIKTWVWQESNEDGDKTLIFASVSARQRLKINPRNTLVTYNIAAVLVLQLNFTLHIAHCRLSFFLSLSYPPPQKGNLYFWPLGSTRSIVIWMISWSVSHYVTQYVKRIEIHKIQINDLTFTAVRCASCT
jgi:hypothetical protein